MAKETNTKEKIGLPNTFVEGTRKLFLAGLGTVMLVQDELGDLSQKLVDRGETTEQKGRERVESFISERKKQTKDVRKRVESDFDKRMNNVLHRLNMPTQAEMKSLNTKITRLTKKVDELKKAMA